MTTPTQNPKIPLNPEQKKAAEAPTSPLLIVAGAGTGKTRTLISRIVHLIAAGTPPERICAITFTNKAAQEMAHRIGTEKGKSASGAPTPYIGTFHSLGARILRKECRSVGRDPNFAIFDDHDSFDLIKKTVKAVSPSKKKETPALFAKKISELKNLDATRKAVKDSAEEDELRKIFNGYEAALARNNAFDFDDLIEKPVAIFKAHPEILKKYQEKYDAILVDEYQDINPKQYEFVKLLAGAHRNITVVGDDEQTIYTWRYADIRIFLDFDKDWPGATVQFLEENYRSTGNIINGASAVVGNNRFRTPKKLWTSENDGSLITLYEAWGENEEGAWIAGEIQKLKTLHDSPEVAVLYRTNAQSRAVEQALIRAGIPYKIFGGLKFYERREVKDVVAALRWASNQKDELSKERLEKNLTKKKFAEFRMNMSAVTMPTNPKPIEVMKMFLKTFNYFEYLESNFINANERQENIAELINFVSGFENLTDLLERLSLLQSTDVPSAGDMTGTLFRNDQSEAKKNIPVHLSTIHMAKGLEFDAVFIAGVAEGILPHMRSIDSDASLEEERRLMYVAMTRARKHLFISFYGLPSRFISEIPEAHIQLRVSGDEPSSMHGGIGDNGRMDGFGFDADDGEFVEY